MSDGVIKLDTARTALDDEDAVTAFISQYYTSSEASVPGTILIPPHNEDLTGLEKFLSDESGHKVEIISPQRGDRRRLLDYAVINSQEEIKRIISAENRNMRILGNLQKKLALAQFPHRIEAYDISNLGNTGIVAAMTVFIDGKKSKKDYRKFRFRDQLIQNDIESMTSCIRRRFGEYLKNTQSFAELPDLILIDGGSEQTSAAAKTMCELGIKVSAFGMVKDDRHRPRALVSLEGSEVNIASDMELFSFIGNIQEETHRSAIDYQKNIRKEQFSSVLDEIPGIGTRRRTLILKKYKSVKAVKSASLDELKEILPVNAANAVYDYFHKDG